MTLVPIPAGERAKNSGNKKQGALTGAPCVRVPRRIKQNEKMPPRSGWHILSVEAAYFRLSAIATATATVIPTMGLLPAPRKPIISTSKPPKGGFCGAAQRVLHILFQCGKHVTEEW